MSLLPCATFASPDVPLYASLNEDVTFKSVTADSVITEELILNNQTITASDTAIYLNGTPYGGGGGGGGVNTVTGSAPITVTGTSTNPVVGINLSGIVQTAGAQTITGAKKFSVLPQSVVGLVPTDDEEFVNKLYVDNQVATVNPSTWSEYEATQDVNMNYFKIANCAEVSDYGTEGQGLTLSSQTGDLAITASQGDIDITCQNLILHQSLNVNGYNLENVGDITGTTSNMIISTATDITLRAETGVVEIDAKNLVIKSQAPSGELISDSTLAIQTDNDMTITATDSLIITAGSMNINNTLSMTTHGITNCLDPVNPQDVATKHYVDSRPAPVTDNLANTLLAGNSAGSSSIDMNGNPITGVSRVSLSGLLPTVTTAAGSLTVGGLLNTNITAGGITTISAPLYVSIGSVGYTTIENLHIDNSVISKEGSNDDLQFENVQSINPSSGATLALGSSVELASGGQVTVNTNGENLSLTGGITSIFGSDVSVSGSSVTIAGNAGAGNPIWLQPTTANNVYVGAVVPNPVLDDSSVLNVASNTRGIYIPRLTTTQREAIPNPQNGLMVYDTTVGDLCIYAPRGWAKMTLSDLSGNLLDNLGGLGDTGAPARTLTGFQSVVTTSVSADAIAPLDPLVQPYITVFGDLSLPDNSRIDFGAIDPGDGTIKATGTLNLEADNRVAINTPAVEFNVTTIDITSDNYIQLYAPTSIALNSGRITLNQTQGIIMPSSTGLNNGTAGDVITSQGPGLPARWQPLIVSGTLTGTTPLLVRGGSGEVFEGTVSVDNNNGVLF
jgi:hypothetical protein